MQIEITAGGIYASTGKEIAPGTVLTVKDEPLAWAGRYRVISGGKVDEAVAVTNDEPKLPLEAKDVGNGWYAVTDANGKEHGKKLRKDDADAFNGMSDEDKLALLKDED